MTLKNRMYLSFSKQQQFVSDASHELKTPLTVIESYAQLLKRWGRKKPEVLDEAIEAIHGEAIRMKQMTQQMLQIARNEEISSEIGDFDLVELVRQTVEDLQQAYHRKVELITDQSKLMVRLDQGKVKQLLVILLDNALKYSQQAVKITLSRKSEQVKIIVQDFGIGIPEKDLSRVFDRFYRVDEARNRETGGTGLGLSIAQQIVASHQGRIHIESKEGEGTQAIVTLPISHSIVNEGKKE